MSANNWEVCPKCLTEAKEASDKATAEVYAQYGKVPPKEFDRLRDELPTVNPEDYRTFREDYEFWGAEKGEVSYSYSGRCEKCGTGVDLKGEKRFFEEADDA